jgi:hypothetical protein
VCRLHVIGSSSLPGTCEPATSSHQFALDVCQAPVVRPMDRNAQQRPFLGGQYKTWLQRIQYHVDDLSFSSYCDFSSCVMLRDVSVEVSPSKLPCTAIERLAFHANTNQYTYRDTLIISPPPLPTRHSRLPATLSLPYESTPRTPSTQAHC